MPDAMATIAGCVTHARRRLPRYEADLIVSDSLHVPRSHLYAFGERIVSPASFERVAAAIARRQGGEPVAYILRRRGFWGLDLEVTPDVLIPRPDTETLVGTALPLIADDARVLDLGTGCGAIALAIATERPGAMVVATDIDPACIALCRRNAGRLGVRVETRLADCFDGLDGRFDAIVSNPPYVDDADARVERGEVRFEPRRALLGGPNGGLDFIARLVGAASERLVPDGWLCIEHGYDQGESVACLFEEHGYRGIQGHADYEGRPRVTVGRRHEATVAPQSRAGLPMKQTPRSHAPFGVCFMRGDGLVPSRKSGAVQRSGGDKPRPYGATPTPCPVRGRV